MRSGSCWSCVGLCLLSASLGIWQRHAIAIPMVPCHAFKNASRQGVLQLPMPVGRIREARSLGCVSGALFGRALSGEGDYGTSEKWHKRRDPTGRGRGGKRKKASFETSLVINGRSMGGHAPPPSHKADVNGTDDDDYDHVHGIPSE